MTSKQKAGCIFGLMAVFIQLPISWLYSYLLLVHIGATSTLWLLFWINIPISLGLSLGFKMVENFMNENEEK